MLLEVEGRLGGGEQCDDLGSGLGDDVPHVDAGDLVGGDDDRGASSRSAWVRAFWLDSGTMWASRRRSRSRKAASCWSRLRWLSAARISTMPIQLLLPPSCSRAWAAWSAGGALLSTVVPAPRCRSASALASLVLGRSVGRVGLAFGRVRVVDRGPAFGFGEDLVA